jgi:hypothetical protein
MRKLLWLIVGSLIIIGLLPTCVSAFEQYGYLSHSGDYKINYGITSAYDGVSAFALSGPTTADFDLYVYDYTTNQVHSSTSSSSDEKIEFYRGQGWQCNVLVYDYWGSGTYHLWTN